jgi:hypothetical protein
VKKTAWGVCAAVAIAALATGCSKSETPKVDAATERAEATKRASEGPFGTQVNALETAKGIEADVNRKAADAVDKIEKDAK